MQYSFIVNANRGGAFYARTDNRTLDMKHKLYKQEHLHGGGRAIRGRSAGHISLPARFFLYRICITRNCLTLKTKTKVAKYNVQNGPVRWHISTYIKVKLEYSFASPPFSRYSHFSIRDIENVGQGYYVQHSQWHPLMSNICWLIASAMFSFSSLYFSKQSLTSIEVVLEHFSLALTFSRDIHMLKFVTLKRTSRSWCKTVAVSSFDGKYLTSSYYFSNFTECNTRNGNLYKSHAWALFVSSHAFEIFTIQYSWP